MRHILHIGEVDKFTAPLFALMARHIDLNDHRILCRVGNFSWPMECQASLLRRKGVAWLFYFIIKSYNAKKIIIHGLYDSRVIFLLSLQPWLLKKCCWVLWGGDLYTYSMDERNLKWKVKEFFRRKVIERISCVTTTVPGDFLLLNEWYSTKASFVENLMYPSHLVRKNINTEVRTDGIIRVQVGNSADPGNCHIEILDLLSKLQNQNFKIYCPLSYGDFTYRDTVIEYGVSKFGSRFRPITEFMAFEAYSKYMNTIDVAIFNHRRQQGMGNIIGLMSLGKRIYLRSDITPFEFFKEKGFSVFPLDELEKLEKLSANDARKNIYLANKIFTVECLIQNWKKVFN